MPNERLKAIDDAEKLINQSNAVVTAVTVDDQFCCLSNEMNAFILSQLNDNLIQLKHLIKKLK
jgi:ethanolamine transporter EutH